MSESPRQKSNQPKAYSQDEEFVNVVRSAKSVEKIGSLVKLSRDTEEDDTIIYPFNMPSIEEEVRQSRMSQ